MNTLRDAVAVKESEIDAITSAAPKIGPTTYKKEVRVTFCYTNAEGNVSHDQYARLFGEVRELFGLDFMPNFSEEAGKKYLLKTRDAYYQYLRDFYFGDTILIEMWVEEVRAASFILVANFINKKDKKVHVVAKQQIVYTDMSGRPKRIPEELKNLLNLVTKSK